MKGEELKLEDVETPHTLGGMSDTLRCMNLYDLARGEQKPLS
jgi:hypothetical protein